MYTVPATDRIHKIDSSKYSLSSIDIRSVFIQAHNYIDPKIMLTV